MSETPPPLPCPGEQWQSMRNSRMPRRYVMILPTGPGGVYKGRASSVLRSEMERRERHGMPFFEFLAPSYVNVRRQEGQYIRTDHPLFFNYVFIHASEQDLFQMKQTLPQFNFLPRVHSPQGDHYPYLSDAAMENLRRIIAVYADEVPLYTPGSEPLMKGDKVRIVEGSFAGVEATVVTGSGGDKDVMVSIDACSWVPLLSVRPGQYEVISLQATSRQVYTRLNVDHQRNALYAALRRMYESGRTTDEDYSLGRKILRQYGCLEMESDILQCNIYSMLLPACRLTDDKERFQQMSTASLSLLSQLKAFRAKASLLVALSICTGSDNYRQQATSLIDAGLQKNPDKKYLLELRQQLLESATWKKS